MTVETRPLDNVQSLPFFAPELVMVAAVLLLIVWDLVASPAAKTRGLVVISLAAFGFSAAESGWLLSRDLAPQNLFYGLLAFDRFSHIFRILFAFVSGAIALFSIPPIPEGHTNATRGVRADRRDQGEFFTLLMVLT